MNKNIIKIYEGTKRRFSGQQEKFEKSLPPLISGEATVTSANLEMFLDTSKIYFGQLDKIAKRIAKPRAWKVLLLIDTGIIGCGVSSSFISMTFAEDLGVFFRLIASFNLSNFSFSSSEAFGLDQQFSLR
ncbi:hypothetical protein ADUPG1_000004 [Aduncisulcus paluster]|uniref:Uncharacterized protein n=1 Tax=Aduncisulcus paluster TaxID=2918883 RepID=A0ABQ5K7D3_9EUKA|nr:hypothetical protein ADUPG1_000004 [Aduncisulcus paluster]